jgi:hypothetical protein
MEQVTGCNEHFLSTHHQMNEAHYCLHLTQIFAACPSLFYIENMHHFFIQPPPPTIQCKIRQSIMHVRNRDTSHNSTHISTAYTHIYTAIQCCNVLCDGLSHVICTILHDVINTSMHGTSKQQCWWWLQPVRWIETNRTTMAASLAWRIRM